ncbi:unnamed protein product [Acanthoscelides obtectus]|uniref:Uncharacterized protein n=1 Tax=Acanthoscelides obtectus TaxID=200917 RepID=A0A9P0JX59_ACAOB|nr:unnamed protein product [Acanthoscelides obtectus]CAK1638160.1 hypothetical protein AOBTE_LOCUS10420 [Acanthoscelides obtectus]
MCLEIGITQIDSYMPM